MIIYQYISIFLCVCVCVQPGKKKQRALVIEFFIDVARECFNIGNFNSLMAIICECVRLGCSQTQPVQ